MLLAISFVHILPEAKMIYMSYLEAQEKEEKSGEEGHDGHDEHGGPSGFPLPFFLFFVGFSTMLLFDQVLFKGTGLKSDDSNAKNQVAGQKD